MTVGQNPGDGSLRMRAIQELFALLWADYGQRVPDAGGTEVALKARGERWIEDHVAFRTLPGTPCDAQTLGSFFESLGYRKMDRYRFHEKRLNAFWMSPPIAEGALAWEAPPKVFISELDVSSFPAPEQERLHEAIATVRSGLREAPSPWAGDLASFLEVAKRTLVFESRETRLSHQQYEHVRSFSEYAAWTLVYGVCINHFTVSVHLMDGFDSLATFNAFLKNDLHLKLNITGGSAIKGSPEVDLEQSATLAAPMTVQFADGSREIPYAFVEFAYRFLSPRDAEPKLWQSYFQGFVEQNADRIFSSTDHQAG